MLCFNFWLLATAEVLKYRKQLTKINAELEARDEIILKQKKIVNSLRKKLDVSFMDFTVGAWVGWNLLLPRIFAKSHKIVRADW